MDSRLEQQAQNDSHTPLDRDHFLVWAISGPIFLFIAFTLILFRVSWDLWPFILISAIGLFATAFFKRTGFFFSCLSLTLLSVFSYSTLTHQPWSFFFVASSVLSWGITLLGHHEIAQWFDAELHRRTLLQESVQNLKQKLVSATLQQQPVPWDSTEEFKAALASRNAAVENQNRAYEELDKLRDQNERLREEIDGYQRKEKAFQIALEDAQAQVLRFKYAESLKPIQNVNPIVPIEDENASSEMRPIEYQHALLKEQFEEKSIALNEARKELFRLEGELFILKKEKEEPIEDLKDESSLVALSHRCEALEAEVIALEGIISTLSLKKKEAKPRRSRVKRSILPEMLQEAIDQTSKQYSLLE
jgi:hypothetical protein